MPNSQPFADPKADLTAECRNCGEPLLGPFCHRCGQEARDLRRPLGAVLADSAADLWGYDSRLLRTLRTLVLHPGRLSRDYLAGRRVRYVRPLRLYLLSALLFFALFATVHSRFVRMQIGPKVEGEKIQAPLVIMTDETPEKEPSSRLRRGEALVAKEPGRFQRLFVTQVPRAVFLLVPFFAMLLRLFFRGSGLFYGEQLVVSFHLHTFAFLMLSLIHILGVLPPLPTLFEASLLLPLGAWAVFYVWRSLRVVEETSWFGTAWRMVGIAGLYQLGVAAVVSGLVIGILWWAGGS